MIELTPESRAGSRKPWTTKQALHDRLAIVEGAVDRNGADIVGAVVVIMRRCTSEMRPVREQHDEVDLPAIAKRLDSRAAGVAGSSHDDGAPLAAPGKRVIHQPRKEAHRQSLKASVDDGKVQAERVDAELAERRHGRMTKIAIGLAGEAREIGGCNRVVGKGLDDVDRNLGIRSAGETRDRRGVEARPSLRAHKVAIAGKASQHGFGKAERGCLASGRNILHFTFPPPLDAG